MALSRSREPVTKVLQSRFLHGCPAFVQQLHDVGVRVDAEYLVALARENRRERCSELSEPDDGDPHGYATSAVIRRCQPNVRSSAPKRRFGIQRKYGCLTYRYST